MRYVSARILPLFVTGMTCCVIARSDPAPIITLHYYERPPFHYTAKDGHVEGIIPSAVELIFKRADIPFKWQLTPTNRILAILKGNTGQDCTAGWYKTPERESYAQFSLPIYRDLPLQGLARADFPAPDGITAKELIARQDVRLLLKQNFSQGAYMDAMIADMPAQQVQRVTVEVPMMVKMIQANRADMIITTEEETDYFISQSGYQAKDFKVLKFPDVPAVEQRYILCSKFVSPQVLDRLDLVIKGLNSRSQK